MIAYKSADQLAKLIKDKEISSVELLDYYISRVEKYNSDINAIIVKDGTHAMILIKSDWFNKNLPLLLK